MGFLFFPVMPMGLRWAALRAAGAPLLLNTVNRHRTMAGNGLHLEANFKNLGPNPSFEAGKL